MTPEPLAFVGTSDLSGLVRGKSVPLEALPSRIARGVGIAPSGHMMSPFGPILTTPFGTAGEVVLMPDLTTQAAIPAGGGLPDIQLLLGDYHTVAGEPWPYCPRHFLRAALADLAAHRLALQAAFEQELVYTGVEDRPGAPYTLDALRRQGPFGGTLLAAIRAAGIAPDSFLAEYGPRQFEVTVAPAPGLRAADAAVLVRELARACAAMLGERAILAPMLDPGGIGNGTHIHWSLWTADGKPATHDPDGPEGLSRPAEHFCAGLLRALPWLAAITAPSVPSYYRLRPNRWAPTSADLGLYDRGSAVRVCPVYGRADTEAQFNVEFRVGDATASPYLALGALVRAGLDGLRHERRLADHVAAPLPTSLGAALDALEASADAAAALGDLHGLYLRYKRAELASLDGLGEAAICDRYAAIY